MAELAYNAGKGRLAAGAITAGGTNLRAAVITASKASAAAATLTTVAAITTAGATINAQRITLTGVTVTVDQANGRVNLDSADIAFPATPGVTALALIIYDATTDTSDATRIPLYFYDTGFGAGIPLDGGLNITVTDFARVN